jgi:MFS family permease
VFREPRLRRLELAWGGFYVGEWTQFVALSIYAYRHGGATAVGVFGLVRMGAAALAIPFGGMLTDRYPRQRVLVGSYALRAAALGATAAAAAGGARLLLVFCLAAVAAAAAAPVRPATLSLVPQLARTAEELVAANVASSSLEGVGTLVGPIAGGVVTVATGAATAVAVAAAVHVGCAVSVASIRREGDVVRAGGGRGLAALAAGARTLAQDAKPRSIVLLFASQTFVRGLLNVLLTVAALGVLGVGGGGLGWLNATLGAGAIAGAAGTVGIVGRRRLAGLFALALVLWGAPIAVIGVAPHAAVAFVALAVVGVGNALLDVSGFTLLQRTVDDHVLGRVFGTFEILVAIAVATGSGLAAVAVHELGLRTSFVLAGCLLPALALLSRHALRQIDDEARVPEERVRLLAAVPLFAPLAVTTLERLASRARGRSAGAGEVIVEEGSEGDAFYVIAAGRVEVLRSGETVRELERGETFGEIALLRDTPRTATCRALTDVELLELDRATFVGAVSGDLHSSELAEELVEARLASDAA